LRGAARIDKNLAGIEVDIADLDVDELAHAHRRIEEQLEQDLVLQINLGRKRAMFLGRSVYVLGPLQLGRAQSRTSPRSDLITDGFLTKLQQRFVKEKNSGRGDILVSVL
jgi:hypothetical protein